MDQADPGFDIIGQPCNNWQVPLRSERGAKQFGSDILLVKY